MGLHAPNKHHSRRWKCKSRESSRCRRDIAFSRAHLAKNAMRATPPPHPTQLGSPRTKNIPISTVTVSKQGIFEVPSWHRVFEGTFGEKRNASQPTAASHSACVSTHQTHINLDDERVKTRNLRGVVVTSRFRGPNSAKHAMRAIPPPHPIQLGSPDRKSTRLNSSHSQ